MDPKALIQERVKLNEENRALLDKVEKEGRTLNTEEQSEFDKKEAKIAEIRGTLDRIEKQEVEERAMGESRGRQTETAVAVVENTRAQDAELAFRAWALGDYASNDMIEAAQRLAFNFRRRELETRALSSVTATQGQASIPDEMMRSYWEIQKWYGRVRNVSTVLNTSTGAPLPIPTVSDVANTGEIVADGGAVTTTADPLFGQVVLGSFKYSSKAVIVPIELLQDSSINLPVYLGSALGTRIGRKQNTDFTVGAGTTLPFGVATQSTVGKTATGTNVITWDEVIDLFHSVDIAYRSMPSAAFMMHDTTAASLRKLKDSNNQYLWEISVQFGQPDRALGVPVIINNDMDTLATAKKVVLYGAFAAYHVRDAGAVQIYRADELRILNGQVVFLAFQRSDGNLVDVTAVKHLLTA